MKGLKQIVYSNLRRLAVFVMLSILFVAGLFQTMLTQNMEKQNAEATFIQIEQILEQNRSELRTVEAEYRRSCLLNAETISYIIQHNPDILGNIEEFRKLARMVEVDEIHIFDKTGRIFTGTHPEYYNYTFDSGEQMNFFKPMIEDKSLRLCQDITPNTAEGKLVQYSALWSSDNQFIVQVGMYPDSVLEAIEKNELPYIFSLFQGSKGVSLYAIDANTNEVIASTDTTNNNKSAVDIGFKKSVLENCPNGYYLTINGESTYAIFKRMDDIIVAYTIASVHMYEGILSYTLMMAICLFIILEALVFAMKRFTEHYIISSIDMINCKFREIAEGNSDEKLDIQSSLEFSELSSHFNNMIQVIFSEMDKMNYVLNRTNMHIGVYEYNEKMKNVRFTEHVPEIFGFNQEEMECLSKDYRKLREFVNAVKEEPVSGMENTYRYVGKSEMYIKLEEIKTGNDCLGIVIDVTEDTVKLFRAEEERDYDILTGLYNRRGLERRLDKIFKDTCNMACGALIMIDSDDMKGINDTYGHAVGDLYIKRHGELLKNIDAPNAVSARIGGDEFVLFVYGYETDEDVQVCLSQLRAVQDRAVLTLEDGREIPLHFSFGYEILKEGANYGAMLASADEYMYNSKRIRKKLAQEEK